MQSVVMVVSVFTELPQGGSTTSRGPPTAPGPRRRAQAKAGSAEPPRSGADDAAETDVAGRGVDRLPLSCGRSVPQAVVRRAQVRSALRHPPRDGSWAMLGCSSVTRGFAGAQHACSVSPCAGAKKSLVHSQTLPAMSTGRSRSAGRLRPGTCPRSRSSRRFCHGNSPCHVLAIGFPPGRTRRPRRTACRRGHRAPRTPTPPRSGAPCPPTAAYASASSKATCVTGWRSRPWSVLPGPSGWRQLAPGTYAHQLR